MISGVLSRYVLTTIGQGIVAMVETPSSEKPKRGEYLLSGSCVQKNLESGTFIDITSRVGGSEGRVYALASDLD